MADTLRIGVIGAGGIVKQRHLPGLARLDGVRVVTVCNRSEASGRAVAAEWGIPEVETSWEAVVARSDLDIIWIGTWPYLHRPITEAALAAGKHVFCQARMTMNLADARAMYEAASRSDRVAALCPPPHHLPVDKLVRQLLAEGALGELRHVRLTATAAGATEPDRPATWRENAGYSGLNALALGIYAEILLGWCGPCREVLARTRCWIDRRPDGRGGTYHLTIPDSLRVLADFASGAEGVLQLSNVAHHGGPDRLELYGSEGTIVYEAFAETLRYGARGEAGLRELAVPPELANPWRVEENFIAAVRGLEEPQTTFAAGLAYMEFVEAVHRSAASGSLVRLPLLA